MIHVEKSAVEMWMAMHDDSPGSPQQGYIVEAEFYTLLLRAGSYYIDAPSRERVLRAQRLGARNVHISPAASCSACDCRQTVVIRLPDVLGFIAHEAPCESTGVADKVIPLRALA